MAETAARNGSTTCHAPAEGAGFLGGHKDQEPHLELPTLLPQHQGEDVECTGCFASAGHCWAGSGQATRAAMNTCRHFPPVPLWVKHQRERIRALFPQ